MDSSLTGFLYNASTLETLYNQVNKDDGYIDLGLSLKTLHPQACHTVIPVSQSLHLDSVIVPGVYRGLIDWPYTHPNNHNGSKTECSRINPEECGENSEAIQIKEAWSYHSYVKVNMYGVVVGRKICPGDHSGYSSLAVQLEEMFGRQSASGLRLFTAVSEFILFYKDRQENWRPAGDVPWKEFIDSVKRLRIVPKNQVAALLIAKNLG